MSKYYSHYFSNDTENKTFWSLLEEKGTELKIDFPFKSNQEFARFLEQHLPQKTDTFFTARLGEQQISVTIVEAFMLQSIAMKTPAPQIALFQGEEVRERIMLADLGVDDAAHLLKQYSELRAFQGVQRLEELITEYLALPDGIGLDADNIEAYDFNEFEEITAVRDRLVEEITHSIEVLDNSMPINGSDYGSLYRTINDPRHEDYLRNILGTKKPEAKIVPGREIYNAANAHREPINVIDEAINSGELSIAPANLGAVIKDTMQLQAMAKALFEGVISCENENIGVICRFTHNANVAAEIARGVRNNARVVATNNETKVFKTVLPGYAAEVEVFSDNDYAYVIVTDHKAPEGYIYYGPAAPELRVDVNNTLTYSEDKTVKRAKNTNLHVPRADWDVFQRKFAELLDKVQSAGSIGYEELTYLNDLHHDVFMRHLANQTIFAANGFTKESNNSSPQSFLVKKIEDSEVEMHVRPIWNEGGRNLQGVVVETLDSGEVEDSCLIPVIANQSKPDFSTLEKVVHEMSIAYDRSPINCRLK